jgi:hypothetical protein
LQTPDAGAQPVSGESTNGVNWTCPSPNDVGQIGWQAVQLPPQQGCPGQPQAVHMPPPISPVEHWVDGCVHCGVVVQHGIPSRPQLDAMQRCPMQDRPD